MLQAAAWNAKQDPWHQLVESLQPLENGNPGKSKGKDYFFSFWEQKFIDTKFIKKEEYM